MPASDYQYWLGKETEDLKAVGKRGIHRRDADDKATGKAVYGRDFQLPGMLYARVLASPYAHVKIKSMDTSKAEALPGVRAVLRYDDPEVPKRIFHEWDPDVITEFMFPSMSMPTFVLGDEAFFAGSPIGVAIAADELDIADEALELVEIEWEELPFVIDVEKALEPNAPIVYEYMQSWDPNTAMPSRLEHGGVLGCEQLDLAPGWTGAENANNIKALTTFSLPGTDLNKGFAEADQTIEFSFRRTEVYGSSPEILSTAAMWTDNGTLEFWQAGETPPPPKFYALMLGIHESQIHIHSPYAGGQFGGWDFGISTQSCQVPIAALLSKRTGMPIKIFNQRKDEHFGEMDEGVYNCKVGFKNDGTITAVEIDTIIAQLGDIGFTVDTSGGGHFIECTCVPNLQGTSTAVFLNKHCFGASRCEQQTNAKVKQNVFTRVAAALGVDEGTIALKNDGQEGYDTQWVSQFKQTNKLPDIDSLKVVLELGKDTVNFDEKFHPPGAKMLSNGKLHGMCMAPNHEFSNGGTPYPFWPSLHPCHISVNAGKIFMTAERPDCGVDSRTGYSRIIAEVIGMKLEDVLYPRSQEENPSEPQTSFQGGGGSITFTYNAWVVVATARLLKQKMLAKCAATLGVDADQLDIVDSELIFKDDPSNSTPLEAISTLQGLVATSRDTDYTALNMPNLPTAPLMVSRCVNILEVEVDPETGGVEITNAVAVNDVGQAISPETCEGQIYGAAIMGYSTGTCEEVVYDQATGVILNPNFIDYKIFTMLDLPDVTSIMVESRMGYGPYGSAGVGEPNTTFCSAMTPAAIYNATGVWVDTYPPTPERILKALGKA